MAVAIGVPGCLGELLDFGNPLGAWLDSGILDAALDSAGKRPERAGRRFVRRAGAERRRRAGTERRRSARRARRRRGRSERHAHAGEVLDGPRMPVAHRSDVLGLADYLMLTRSGSAIGGCARSFRSTPTSASAACIQSIETRRRPASATRTRRRPAPRRRACRTQGRCSSRTRRTSAL